MLGLPFGGSTYTQPPALTMLLSAANQSMQNARQTWLPTQNYYFNRLTQDAPALKQQAQGMAAATARAKGTAQTIGDAAKIANRSGPGGGSFVMGTGAGFDKTATDSAIAPVGGGLAADQAYHQGLQRVIQSALGTQRQAMGGLSQAASIQGSEEGQTVQQNQQNAQGIGELLGMGTTAGLMALGGPAAAPVAPWVKPG